MTSSTDYRRTVSAALSETAGKFALAEALALDIPTRRGRPAHDEASTDSCLSDARELIIAAGGEPRAVATLRNYRLTAIWVKDRKTGSFLWLPGRSWSAHEEARQRGLTYAGFASLSPDVTAVAIREASGTPPVTFRSAGERYDEPGTVVMPQHEERTEPEPEPEHKPEPPVRPGPEIGPKPMLKGRSGPVTSSLNLVVAFRGLHRQLERIVSEIAMHGVSDGDREVVLDELTWLSGTLAQIRKDVKPQRSRTVPPPGVPRPRVPVG